MPPLVRNAEYVNGGSDGCLDSVRHANWSAPQTRGNSCANWSVTETLAFISHRVVLFLPPVLFADLHSTPILNLLIDSAYGLLDNVWKTTTKSQHSDLQLVIFWRHIPRNVGGTPLTLVLTVFTSTQCTRLVIYCHKFHVDHPRSYL